MRIPDNVDNGAAFEPHVVILGNVIDGIRIFGPFKTREDACQWGEYAGEGDWYIANLQKPEPANA